MLVVVDSTYAVLLVVQHIVWGLETTVADRKPVFFSVIVVFLHPATRVNFSQKMAVVSGSAQRDTHLLLFLSYFSVASLSRGRKGHKTSRARVPRQQTVSFFFFFFPDRQVPHFFLHWICQELEGRGGGKSIGDGLVNFYFCYFFSLLLFFSPSVFPPQRTCGVNEWCLVLPKSLGYLSICFFICRCDFSQDWLELMFANFFCSVLAGYDMSPFVRRYAKYLSEKSVSYRTVAFDFCKVRRGWGKIRRQGVSQTLLFFA